ncbi:MAG: hypothetical protein H0V44_03940 [Planctomycetes bacterium]|nr:hypothetical protein [Planctomycetota bacterium]
MTRSATVLCVLLMLVVAGSGCGSYRGLPSHGGGKRFDEEQRVVAASIRQAVSAMDVGTLGAKRVQVVVTGIAHSGGGRDRFPGTTSANVGVGAQFDDTSAHGERPSGASSGGPWVPDWRNQNEHTGLSANASVSTRLEHEYDAYQMWTDADLIYLEHVVRMHLFHLGAIPTEANPEMRLRVLVDVLGTNRSRNEWIVANRDELEASCELTWYVTSADDATLVQAASRSGATASYTERGMLLVSGLSRTRTVTPGIVGDFVTPKAP